MNSLSKICRVLALMPILWLTTCNGRTYSLEEFVVSPVPPADVHPELKQSVPCLNIAQSQATDFMAKEVAGLNLVPLKTNDNCLIGSISQLFLKGDTIIVVDGQKAKRIMLFSKQGKFLRQIGSEGSGPGEYATITTARISPEGIEINDWHTNRFIKYDYEGNVLTAVTFSQTNPHNLYHVGGNQFLAAYSPYHEQWPFALQWLENDSVVASAFPFKLKRNETAASIFALDRDKIGFHIPYSDTIFSIADRRIIPEYTLGLMNCPEVEEFIAKSVAMTAAEKSEFLWTNRHSPPSYVEVFAMDNYLIINHQQQGSVYLSVVDRHTLQCRNYLRGTMTTTPLAIYLPPDLRSASGTTLVGFIDENYPMHLPEKSRELIEKDLSAADRQLLKDYDYGNNNPIVWLMELKQEPGKE